MHRILLSFTFWIFPLAALLSAPELPRAEQGLLDLSAVSLSEQPWVRLDGEWDFMWEKFVDPQNTWPTQDSTHYVPAHWGGFSGKQGFASYRLKVKLGKIYSQPLALKIPEMATAYGLYLNGKLVAQVGKPGVNPDSAQSKSKPLVIPFEGKSETLELIFHVSNFTHKKGGLWDSILLGEQSKLEAERESNLWATLFLSGAILIIGLYHFGMFLLRKEDLQALFFSLLCAMALSRLISTGEMFIVELCPNIPWELRVKMEHLPIYFMPMLGLLFTRELFPNEFHNKPDLVIQWVGGIGGGICLLLPAYIHSHVMNIYQFYVIFILGYIVWGLLKAIKHRRAGAFAYFIGGVFIIGTTINDILYVQNIINSGYLTNYGIFIFFFAQAVVLSIKYAEAYKSAGVTATDLQSLNEELERKVKERTRQLAQKTNQLELRNQGLQLSETEARMRATELKMTLDKLKSAQVQLVQSEKMASLGQLTAGIAHEINNPLNYMFVGIDNLKHITQDFLSVVALYDKIIVAPESEKPKLIEELNALKEEIEYESLVEDLQMLLQDMKYGASRTAEIVKGLRTFSRLDEHAAKATDLHLCIDSTLVILKSQYKDRVEIQKDYDKSLPQISCLAGQINQVLMNLLNNALQAIEGEGVVSISTTYIPDRDAAQVKIADTGIGIPDKIKHKIFDPFFTTKDVGVGTGLGLSITHGIIQKHKGEISVESEKGNGTTFTLLLPLDMDLGMKD